MFFIKSVYISLPTVEAVQRFVERISPLEGNIDILSDGYVLDAKSLMGIFGLDLSQPIMLTVEKDTEEAMHSINPFIAKMPDCASIQ